MTMAGWFRKKRFGWGVRPAGWQGWALTAVLIAALIGVARRWPPQESAVPFVIGVVVAIGVYTGIAYATLEHDDDRKAD